MRNLRSQEEIIQNWRGDINQPKVSIQCLTYNHEKYIQDAINGFLIQETDFPYEVIIHDDASSDKTADIVRKYEKLYPNIVKAIYQTENKFSQGKKIEIRNAISSKIKGEYIAYCEGDDYWTDPKKLQKQVDFLSANNEYVITYTAVEAFDKNGIIVNYNGGAKRDLEAIELQKATPINTLTVCFRNIMKNIPPEAQCTRLGDLFLWSLLGHYGKGKFLEDIKPARYRVNDKGVFSQAKKDTRLQMWLITSGALYAYYNRIGNKELSDYFQERNLKASISAYGVYPLLKIFLKKILKIK